MIEWLGVSKSKRHHWWPKRIHARYWTNSEGKVCRVGPDGKADARNPNKKRTGQKLRGHKILPGKVWATNFEDEFQIDNYMHEIISRIRKMVPPDEVFFTSDENHKPFGQDARSGDGAVCFNHVEETLHRKILEFLLSLLIRSPAKRERYNSAPQLIGLPPAEEVGKANMISAFNTAQNLCRKGSVRNQFFVLLHSPSAQFVFGDGCLVCMTDSVTANRLEGKALVPLTPGICVYVCTPLKMNALSNCA